MIHSVAILGSTGSIGTQALDVCLQYKIRVSSLACSSNIDLLYKQIQLFKPEFVAVYNEKQADQLRQNLSDRGPDIYSCPVLSADDGVLAVASDPHAEMVCASMVGMQGIAAVVAAIESGHDIALANKEVMVAAGDLINALLEKHQVKLYPVDSEHSAIWQCLRSGSIDELNRVFLTASGGPFRGCSYDDLKQVTPAMALRHPTWAMGRKISIDSATMMNKGLEIIEAAKLFAIKSDQIEVVVHPQSVIHSMVEWQDGSVIAQLSEPDMRLPIQLAFTWPHRADSPQRRFNPFDPTNATLTFEAVDRKLFKAIDLAYHALNYGGTLPLALNSSNEIAVDAFLKGHLSFIGISDTVEKVMERHVSKGFIPQPNLSDMMATDFYIRQETKEMIGWKE